MSTAEIATPMMSLEQKKRARNVGMSLIFLALVSAFFLSARPGDAGFKLVESFTLVLPAQPFAQALAVVLGALGAIQLYRGFGKWTNVVLAFATAMFVVGFLAWATSGGSFNLTGMLQSLASCASAAELSTLQLKDNYSVERLLVPCLGRCMAPGLVCWVRWRWAWGFRPCLQCSPFVSASIK
jgi:hypothetical protein